MFAFRRSASRLFTSRPSLLPVASRTYTSFSVPSARITSRSSLVQYQRRWATTEREKEGEAPVSKLQPTGPEEVENAIHTEHSSTESPSPAAETASATEALPAGEINESLTAKSSDAAAPPIAETANATEATEEALPAAEVNPDLTARRQSSGGFTSNTPQATLFDRKPTLYIGNLFFDVTETDLIKEFTRFGTVTSAKIIRDARGLSKGFAYVDFASQEAADEAIERLNMQVFEGRRITVQYAARRTGPIDQNPNTVRKNLNPPSKTLFIGNMSFEMTDRDLSNLFRGIRNVIDVRVAIDRRTGQPRGFAHADFIDVKSAMEAMKVLQEKETYGRKLRVDFSYSSSGAPRNQPPPEDVPTSSE